MNKLSLVDCVYCGARIPKGNDVPADPEDDRVWGWMEAEHNEGCEWVTTRAHTYSRTPSGDFRIYWHNECPLDDCAGDGWYFILNREFPLPVHYSTRFGSPREAWRCAIDWEEEMDEWGEPEKWVIDNEEAQEVKA